MATSTLNPHSNLGSEKSQDLYVYLIAFAAAIGGFLFGYDLVIISGANIYFQDQFKLTSDEFGWATSSAIWGCIIAAPIGGWICEKIGRKNTLFFTGLLFALGTIGTAAPLAYNVFNLPAILKAFSNNFSDGPGNIDVFNFYRIVGGLGVGLASLAVPMYLAEISPTRIRGGIMIMYQFAIVIGATLATLAAYYFAKYLGPQSAWHWMFLSEIVPVVAFVVLLFFIPESPRWLMEKKRDDEASMILTRINGPAVASNVQTEIRESLKEETGSYRELLQPGMRKAMLIAILLAIFNNWTGWSSIAYYQSTVYKMAGYTKESDCLFLSFLVLMTHFVLTIVSLKTIDRVGRRTLWNISSVIMIFAMGILGAVFYMKIGGLAVFFALVLVAIPHALGLGPLPWVMMSEMFPNRIRSKAVGITTMVLWIGGWAGAQTFPKMTEFSEKHTGTYGPAFWIFSIICIFSLIFGLRMLVETKNRSLEEIAEHWLHNKPLPDNPNR